MSDLLRKVTAVFLAALTTLAVFGLLLAAFEALAASDAPGLRLTLTLVSAALAFGVGGLVVSLVHAENGVRLAMLFGLLFGGFSFFYIFGLSWQVLAFTLPAVLLAAAGARIPARRSTV